MISRKVYNEHLADIRKQTRMWPREDLEDSVFRLTNRIAHARLIGASTHYLEPILSIYKQILAERFGEKR